MTNPNNSCNSTDSHPPEMIMNALAVHRENSKIWQPNQELDGGRYTILKTLGQGGFGITYLAKDNEQKKLVVIKTINENIQKHPLFSKLRKDLLNEALSLSAFKNPHIVQTYELIQEGDLPCIVMEYIEGQDLELLTQNQPLSIETALDYISQIGEALIVIHQNNLLHRDVKPTNIMIRKDGKNAVLIDFGIARKFDPNNPNFHTKFCSRGFAPIEQGEPLTIKKKPGFYTDVYALAATLYYLLTKQVPIDAVSRYLELQNQHKDPLIPPQQINPNISDELNDAILKGLACLPENRPKTVQEWLDLLPNSSEPKKSKIQHQAPTTRLSNIDESLEKPQKIKRFSFIFSGILAVGVVGLLGVYLNQNLSFKPTVKYCPENQQICLKIPTDWQAKTYQPNAFSFTVAELFPNASSSPSEQGKILIEVNQLNEEEILEQYKANRIAEIKKYSSNSQILQEEKVKINNHQGYKLIYQKEDIDKPIKAMQIGVMGHDQHIYVITYESPLKTYGEWESTARKIINSLEILP